VCALFSNLLSYDLLNEHEILVFLLKLIYKWIQILNKMLYDNDVGYLPTEIF